MNRLVPTVLFDLMASVERMLSLFGVKLEEFRAVAVKVLVLWVVAFIAWRLVLVIAARIVVVADDGDDTRLSSHEKRAQTIAELLRGVGKIVVVLFTIVLTLNQFVDITPLLGGAGILALAVSFGSQSLVKDVIAGFFILVENQFAVGDVIEVAGKTGGVEKMTLRVVMLRDLEGILHIVPNGQITTVSNKTRGWSRAVVDIGVAYNADVDAVLAILRDEAKRFGEADAWVPKLDGMPEVVGVQSLGDNAVTIRVLLRTQPGNQWEAAREFRRLAKIRLDREGVEIPFPQRTVHVRHHGAGPDDPAARAAITDAAAGGA